VCVLCVRAVCVCCVFGNSTVGFLVAAESTRTGHYIHLHTRLTTYTCTQGHYIDIHNYIHIHTGWAITYTYTQD